MRTDHALWRAGRASAARITAGSSGAVAAGRGRFAPEAQHVRSQRSPSASVMRWPSFFSLSSVNSSASRRGRYSLMFVAITRRTRRASLDGLHAIVEASEDQRDPGARFAERECQFTLRIDRIDRHDDAAGLPDTELPDEELGTVRQDESDAIAFPTPSAASSAAKAVLRRSS